MRGIAKRLVFVIVVVLVSLLATQVLAAKKVNKKFKPKDAGTGIHAVLLGKITKRFVVDSSTPQGTFDMISKVKNAQVVVDGQGVFPGSDLIDKALGTGKPLLLVIPPTFYAGHKRRLQKLEDYTLIIRADEKGLSQEDVGRILTLGPYRKIIEIDQAVLGSKLIKSFKRLKQFELRIKMRKAPTSGFMRLVKKSRAASVEFIVPDNFSVKSIRTLSKAKNAKITVNLENNFLMKGLARDLGKLKKAELGFQVPGTFGDTEAATFMRMELIRHLTVILGDKPISEEFVARLNEGA